MKNKKEMEESHVAQVTKELELFSLLIVEMDGIGKECERNRPIVCHIAVEHRQEKIFNLIHGLSRHMKLLVVYRVELNCILNLAAKLAPSSQLNSVPGAALQMQ